MRSLKYQVHEDFQQLKPEEVWDLLRKDNDLALVHLYNKFVDDIYHYGERITHDKELIKDCIQDIFVELWSNRKNLSEVRSLKHYLYKSLKRAIIKKLEKNRKLFEKKTLSESHDIKIVLSYESQLINLQISEQQQQKLLRSLNSLPVKQKEAITLKFLDGFSYQEVADILSISVKSAYNLIYRALALLRDNLLNTLLFCFCHFLAGFLNSL